MVSLLLALSVIYFQNSIIKNLRVDITTLEISNGSLKISNDSLTKQISTNDKLDGILSEEIVKIETSFDEIINQLVYQPRPKCVSDTDIPVKLPTEPYRVDSQQSLWKAYCLATNGADKQCASYGY